MNKVSSILVVFSLLFISFSVFAVPTAQLSTIHYVDGAQVFKGSTVETKNPFEYKVVLNNPTSEQVCVEVTEIISNLVTLNSSTFDSNPIVPDKVGIGPFNKFIFQNVCIPAGTTKDLILNFQNKTNDELKVASIFMRIREISSGCVTDFELFVFNAVIPAIPEFPTPLIPLFGVLGIVFVLSRRKN